MRGSCASAGAVNAAHRMKPVRRPARRLRIAIDLSLARRADGREGPPKPQSSAMTLPGSRGRRNRGPADRGIEPIELVRHGAQHLVDHGNGGGAEGLELPTPT